MAALITMARYGPPPSDCKDVDDLMLRVRVISKIGWYLGNMPLAAARRMATREHALLIKITVTDSPPIYRMVAPQLDQKEIANRK